MIYGIGLICLLAGFMIGLASGIKSQNKIWRENAKSKDTMEGAAVRFKVVESLFYIKHVRQKYKNYLR